MFVKQMSSEDAELPAAEVIYDTPETARLVRRGFVEKKKAGMDFKKIFMCNIVTLATRVRIELMQAIVRQFATSDLKMFVKQFVARPVIVFRKNRNKAEYALTFADAIVRYGSDLEIANLAQAYSRSGRAFHGQLEQTFVILNEKGREAWRNKVDSWEAGGSASDGLRRGRRGGRGRRGMEREVE